MTKSKKVFIANDPNAAQFVTREIYRVLRRTDELIKILRKHGFPVTKDTLFAALTIQKKEGAKEVEQKQIGQGVTLPESFEPFTFYMNCEAIDAALEELKRDARGRTLGINEDEVLEVLDEDAEQMKAELYAALYPGISAAHPLDPSYFIQFADVKEGKVVLPDNLAELVAEETALYTLTEKGIIAHDIHTELANQINGFLACLPALKVSAIQDLFDVDADGKVIARPLDYDLITANSNGFTDGESKHKD